MEVLQDDDYKSIWKVINNEEKQVKRRRRWLMGCAMTLKSGLKTSKTPEFLKDVFLLESLLRKDDVSYEIVKNSVEKGFGAFGSPRKKYVVQDYLHLFDSDNSLSGITKVLSVILDDMNNIGLCRLAYILAGSSVTYDKTCWKLKNVIKQHIPKILKNLHHDSNMELLKQLQILVRDPSNFQDYRVTLRSVGISNHSSVTKLLEELDNMPTQSLSAMHRKLRGIKNDVPKLQSPSSGWSRSRLIKEVKRSCTKMLPEVDQGGELQKPFAEAMTIAALSLNLTVENKKVSLPEFCPLSPETQALQNDILKAIWSLNEMNPNDMVVEELQRLLDPEATIVIQHFRSSVRKMLTEYLFECSEFSVTPKPLLEILAIINKSSETVATLSPSNEDIEEEVECVLNLSSQIRQIAWNILGDHDIDEEFSDAYLENFEESDDDQILEPTQISGPCSDVLEGMGDWTPVGSVSDISHNGFNVTAIPDKTFSSNRSEESPPMLMNDSVPGDTQGVSSSFPYCDESSFPNETQNANRNKYLAIQGICDETSLVTHQIIGRLLEEFLQVEGVDLKSNKRSYLRGGIPIQEETPVDKEIQIGSEEVDNGRILVRVVEELLPSFPKSRVERVEEFMGLK